MLTDNFKDSFGFRVFRTFTLFILSVSLVFTIFSVYYQNREAKERILKEGEMIAGLLAQSSRTGVFAENSDLLRDAVQGIMNQKSVLAVSIYSEDNRTLYSALNEKAEDKKIYMSGSVDKEVVSRLGKGSLLEVMEGKNTIEFLSPVILESINPEEAFYLDNVTPGKKTNVIGYVRVAIGKDILRNEIKSIVFKNVLIAMVFLLSGTIIIYLGIRRVTRPLTSLTEAVRKLGMGESVENVPVESSDEIGKLAITFNNMSDSLKKRDEEKQQLEEKLRQSQKIEAVGTLARGIAHDFNNILATIRGSVYILEKKIDKDSPVKKYAEQIHSSIGKAKNLIQGLLTFSRTQTMRPVPLDVNMHIRRLKPMLENIAGEYVQVKTYLLEDACTIMADVVQMDQVLINLCVNARDAMPDGGILTIATKRIEAKKIRGSEDEIKNFTSQLLNFPASSDFVEISVADTGTGMDSEIKERIFEPFFTTKEVGKGTGLGLSIVYGIVKQHKGHIDLNSEKGEGTVFRVYLPLMGKNLQDKENI